MPNHIDYHRGVIHGLYSSYGAKDFVREFCRFYGFLDIYEEILKEGSSAQDGGDGSGNFGHAGRPGKVGGSASGNGGTTDKTQKAEIIKFNNEAEINPYFYKSENYKKWKSNLIEEELRSIRAYTGITYKKINSFLRTGNGDIKIMREIKNLDSAIDKYELKQPLRVYRIVNNDVGANNHTTHIDKGFISTSCSSNIWDTRGFTLFVIDIPAGKGRGAYINEFSQWEDEEYEFLIKRNSKFRIENKIYKNNTNILYMKMLVNEKN